MNTFEDSEFSFFLWSERKVKCGLNLNGTISSAIQSAPLQRFVEMVMPSLIYNFKMKKFDVIKFNTAKFHNFNYHRDCFPCIKFKNEEHLLGITKSLERGCMIDPIQEGLIMISLSGFIYEEVLKHSSLIPESIVAYIFYEEDGMVNGHLIYMP